MASSEPLKAVVLAAGIGQRLRPLTEDRPKILLSVGGRTLLDRLVHQCARVGVEEVLVVTGHAAENVEALLWNAALPVPVTTVYNPEFATMGNAQSVFVTREAVEGCSMLLFDGDMVFHSDLLHKLMSGTSRSAILVDRGKELTDEDMKVNIDKGGRVKAFGKWLPNTSTGVSIGIERFGSADIPTMFESIERVVHWEGKHGVYYEDAWHSYLDEGLVIGSVDTDGLPWMEIDTPEELAAAEQLLPSLDAV